LKFQHLIDPADLAVPEQRHQFIRLPTRNRLRLGPLQQILSDNSIKVLCAPAEESIDKTLMAMSCRISL
jgi:hypothetical protein